MEDSQMNVYCMLGRIQRIAENFAVTWEDEPRVIEFCNFWLEFDIVDGSDQRFMRKVASNYVLTLEKYYERLVARDPMTFNGVQGDLVVLEKLHIADIWEEGDEADTIELRVAIIEYLHDLFQICLINKCLPTGILDVVEEIGMDMKEQLDSGEITVEEAKAEVPSLFMKGLAECGAELGSVDMDMSPNILCGLMATLREKGVDINSGQMEKIFRGVAKALGQTGMLGESDGDEDLDFSSILSEIQGNNNSSENVPSQPADNNGDGDAQSAWGGSNMDSVYDA